VGRKAVNDADPFGKIKHAKRRMFLRALVESGGNMSRAAAAAGVSQCTPYSKPWKDDVGFQGLLPIAREMGGEQLEAEMIRRAYEGVEEPVGFFRGKPSAYVRRYSDSLGIFLLKGIMREKYAEQHRHGGADDAPPIRFVEMTDDEVVRRATQLANRVAVLSTNGATKNGDGA